jgi:hypothetical protein
MMGRSFDRCSRQRCGRLAGPLLFASTFQPKLPHHSLTQLPWRLIFAPTATEKQRFKLYDVSSDPAETKNIIDERPAIAIEMMQRLVATWHELPRVTREGVVELDQAHIERLRALGYLDGEGKR